MCTNDSFLSSSAVSIIRDNFRKKIRNEQIQKSFQQVRQRIKATQRKQNNSKQKRLNFPANQSAFDNKIKNMELSEQTKNPFLPPQFRCLPQKKIYKQNNQNLCLTVNIQNLNIAMNDQNVVNIGNRQHINLNYYQASPAPFFNTNQHLPPYSNGHGLEIMLAQYIQNFNNFRNQNNHQLPQQLQNVHQNFLINNKDLHNPIQPINSLSNLQKHKPFFMAQPKDVILKKKHTNLEISIDRQRKPALSKTKSKIAGQNQIFKPIQNRKIFLQHQNYTIYTDIIGQGSYSTVYLGRNILTNQKVAIKQIRQLEQNQLRVLMNVQSPYIIKLQYFWKIDHTNQTYLVLELCERNLREELKRGIPFDKKMKYFQHLLKGIDALFSRNIIHRDLKFENILITKDQIAKITDFGLAKSMGSLANVASMRCGTPYTMAPEILLSNGHYRPYYNQKCDIYSLGVLLHEMLYDLHPFNHDTYRVACQDRVKIHKKYGYLDQIIDKALVKDPNRRISWNELKKIYGQKQNIKLEAPIQYDFKKRHNQSVYSAYRPQIKQVQQHQNIVNKLAKQNEQIQIQQQSLTLTSIFDKHQSKFEPKIRKQSDQIIIKRPIKQQFIVRKITKAEKDGNENQQGWLQRQIDINKESMDQHNQLQRKPQLQGDKDAKKQRDPTKIFQGIFNQAHIKYRNVEKNKKQILGHKQYVVPNSVFKKKIQPRSSIQCPLDSKPIVKKKDRYIQCAFIIAAALIIYALWRGSRFE